MAKHIEKIQLYLVENNIDAFLIKSKTMKKWLDTLTGSGCQVLITQKKGYLIVDGRYISEAQKKESDLEIILHDGHITGTSYLEVVVNLLQENDCENLAVEANQVFVKEYQTMCDLGLKVELLDQQILEMRMIKDQDEIEKMRQVIKMTDDIYNQVIKHICVGMTEFEISALVHYYSIKAGAQQMSFETVVTSGERTAYPHGRPTNRQIKKHEPILMDFGIQFDNYQSDMTRVCFIGEPTREMKNIYDTVLKAQLAGLAAIKEGTIASDVDKAARKVIEEAGYGQYFTHGLGHGLGIGDGVEGPYLNVESQTCLKNGMMMSCEPGIYIPEVGGIRIEDDVVIIDGQGVPLNQTTKNYIILEDRKNEL